MARSEKIEPTYGKAHSWERAVSDRDIFQGLLARVLIQQMQCESRKVLDQWTRFSRPVAKWHVLLIW